MRFPPAEVIAAWPVPNYINPENRGPTLLIAELTVLPIALICLGLRIWVRFKVIKRSGWDDWLMIGAGIFSIGVTICVILATQLYGWNLHVWDVPFAELVQGRQVSIAGQTIFLFASGLAKLSILSSYLRIAPPGSLFRRLAIATLILVFALIWIFLIVLWTQCIPASSYWDLFRASQDCISEWPPLAGHAISTVITDFIVFILPMPTLWKLQLPLFQRIFLMVLFGLGGIVIIAGIMRTYWVHFVEEESFDITWDGFSLWLWTAVEVNLGVICGCVPVLRPLLPSSAVAILKKKGSGGSGRTFDTFSLPTGSSTVSKAQRIRRVIEIDIEEQPLRVVPPRRGSGGSVMKVISPSWSLTTDDDDWKKYARSIRLDN